jgi:hypothetical protein
MKAIHQSVRLTPCQFQDLIRLSALRETSRYRVLADVISAGFAAITHEHEVHIEFGVIADELAAISTRLVQVERLMDRALYTGCASYVFARSAAAQRKIADATASEEILDAFNRQRALAEDISL